MFAVSADEVGWTEAGVMEGSPSASGEPCDGGEPDTPRGEARGPTSLPMGSAAPLSPLMSIPLVPAQSSNGMSATAAHGFSRKPFSARSDASQECVQVVVRLKPQQRRVADAYMNYRVEKGPLHSPLMRRRPGSATSTPTTRTLPGASSFRSNASPSASPRSARTPRSARAGGGGAGSHVGAGAGTVLSLSGPAKHSAVGGGVGEVEQLSYEVSDVLAPQVSDEEMCQRLVPGVLEQLAAGYNACVLCYGQTSSGKTHTMNALVPAFTRAIFGNLVEPGDVVELSYIQIYKDRAYDMLAKVGTHEEYGAPLPQPLGTAVCEPKVCVRSADAALSKVAAAQHRRCIKSHHLNARSSRSHTLLSLHITRCLDGVPLVTIRLTLGDLAGSERVKKTGAQGEELSEAITINRSLMALRGLVTATVALSDVLPTRESLLTRYLAARVRQWHLLLIVTASLEKEHAAETRHSLDFAATAKRCVTVKRRARTADRLAAGLALAGDAEELCQRLQATVRALRQRVADLQGELETSRRELAQGSTAAEARARAVERRVRTFEALLRDGEEDLKCVEEDAQSDLRVGQLGPPRSPRLPSSPTLRQLLPYGHGGSSYTALDEDHGASGEEAMNVVGRGVEGDHLLSRLARERAIMAAPRARALHLLRRLRELLPPAPPSPTRDGEQSQPLSCGGRDSASQAVTGPTPWGQEAMVEELHESFLWAYAQLDGVREQVRVLHLAADGLRAENSTLRAELASSRAVVREQAVHLASMEAAAAAAAARARQRRRADEDRHADFFARLASLVARNDMEALSNSTSADPNTLAALSSSSVVGALTLGGVAQGASVAVGSLPAPSASEQKAEAQLQANIVSNMAVELETKVRRVDDLEKKLERVKRLLFTFWNIVTPSQRSQLMDANVSGGGNGASTSASVLLDGGASSVAGGGGSLAQGMRVVQLQSQVQELEDELRSMHARESVAAKEREELTKQAEGLRERLAMMAEQVVGFSALKSGYLQTIERAEGESARLLSMIDQQQDHIAALEQHRETMQARINAVLAVRSQLAAANASLETRIREANAEAQRSLRAAREREREAAARAKTMEESYKSKICALEFRLYKQAMEPSAGATAALGAVESPPRAAPSVAAGAALASSAPPPSGVRKGSRLGSRGALHSAPTPLPAPATLRVGAGSVASRLRSAVGLTSPLAADWATKREPPPAPRGSVLSRDTNVGGDPAGSVPRFTSTLTDTVVPDVMGPRHKKASVSSATPATKSISRVSRNSS